MFTFPEHCKVIAPAMPQAPDALTLTDYVSCKNVHKMWVVVTHWYAADTDYVVGLDEATAVGGVTHAAVTATLPIWADTDHGTTSDGLVRQTDAANWTIDTGLHTDQLVVLEWDPAKHTAGYDCIAMTGSGGNSGNLVAVLFVLQERYPGDPPPTAITD